MLLTHLYKSGQHNRGQCFPFFCLKKQKVSSLPKIWWSLQTVNISQFSKLYLFWFFFDTNSFAVRDSPDTRQLLFSSLSREINPFVLSAAVPHTSHRLAALESSAGPQGWLCVSPFNPHGTRFFPSFTATQRLSKTLQPAREQLTACWLLLLSPSSSLLLLLACAFSFASPEDKTAHLRGKRHTGQLVSALVFFPTLRAERR